jgi:recombination protein U
MSKAEAYHNAAAKGKRSRDAGEFWEGMIESACRNYRLEGLAEITKTPEPMRPLSRPNPKGQFTACFTKQAQPDYKGTLKGGRAVVFEAKHTDADRMQRSVISEEQEKQLNRHQMLGAECFVLVSFGLQQFYRIPWEIFRDMKDHFGRKYIKPEDLGDYQIRLIGYLRFL